MKEAKIITIIASVLLLAGLASAQIYPVHTKPEFKQINYLLLENIEEFNLDYAIAFPWYPAPSSVKWDRLNEQLSFSDEIRLSHLTVVEVGHPGSPNRY